MGELCLFVGALFEQFTVLLSFSIVFSFTIFFLAEILAVTHFDRRLSPCFHHTIVKDQCMFVLDLILRKFLTDESLNFLEDLDVILGD